MVGQQWELGCGYCPVERDSEATNGLYLSSITATTGRGPVTCSPHYPRPDLYLWLGSQNHPHVGRRITVVGDQGGPMT